MNTQSTSSATPVPYWSYGPNGENLTLAQDDSFTEENTQDQPSDQPSESEPVKHAGFKLLDRLLDYQRFKEQLSPESWKAAQEVAKNPSNLKEASIESAKATLQALSLLERFWDHKPKELHALRDLRSTRNEYRRDLREHFPTLKLESARATRNQLRKAADDVRSRLSELEKDFTTAPTSDSNCHLGLEILRHCMTQAPFREQIQDDDSVADVVLRPVGVWQTEEKRQVAAACTRLGSLLKSELGNKAKTAGQKSRIDWSRKLPLSSRIFQLAGKTVFKSQYHKYLDQFGQSLLEGIPNGNDQLSAKHPDSNSASSIPLAQELAGGPVQSGHSHSFQVPEEPSASASYDESAFDTTWKSESVYFPPDQCAGDFSEFPGAGAAGMYQEQPNQEQDYRQQLQQHYQDTSFEG